MRIHVMKFSYIFFSFRNGAFLWAGKRGCDENSSPIEMSSFLKICRNQHSRQSFKWMVRFFLSLHSIWSERNYWCAAKFKSWPFQWRHFSVDLTCIDCSQFLICRIKNDNCQPCTQVIVLFLIIGTDSNDLLNRWKQIACTKQYHRISEISFRSEFPT